MPVRGCCTSDQRGGHGMPASQETTCQVSAKDSCKGVEIRQVAGAHSFLQASQHHVLAANMLPACPNLHHSGYHSIANDSVQVCHVASLFYLPPRHQAPHSGFSHSTQKEYYSSGQRSINSNLILQSMLAHQKNETETQFRTRSGLEACTRD